MPCSLELENSLREQGFLVVAGVDEAGRGPLAGPVVAAAAILPPGFSHPHLDDSKKLTARRRDALFSELTTRPDIRFALGSASVEEIDRLNILRATHLAMRRAVENLPLAPAHLLVDGLPVPGLPVPHTAVVGGDARSLSIAAASVLAKVTRDRLLEQAEQDHPGYGFARHKGYGTRDHLAALARHGPCPLHRRSFAPVAQLVFAGF